jgi:hypothetical protein
VWAVAAPEQGVPGDGHKSRQFDGRKFEAGGSEGATHVEVTLRWNAAST